MEEKTTVVVVFDFDKTILDCDSDEWVVDELGLTDSFARLQFTLPWNSLMDRMMAELHDRGKKVEEISDCLRQAPLHPQIISAIKSAHASGCDLKILSDSNVFFLETILEHHGLIDCFSEINTNPSSAEDGRLRISPYHNPSHPSHGCNICPANMCKGIVMEKIRSSVSTKGRKRFIYVGDGNPDFCAGMKLEEEDILLARKNFPLCNLICSHPTLIKAEVQEWRDGTELGTALRDSIEMLRGTENGSLNPVLSVPVNCKFQTAHVATAASESTIAHKCEPCSSIA